MGFLAEWRMQRARRDDAAVLQAIRMLRPSHASGWPISRLAGINVGRVYPALARMEADGRITSEWEQPQPFLTEFRPRRRLYRVAGTQLVQTEASR